MMNLCQSHSFLRDMIAIVQGYSDDVSRMLRTEALMQNLISTALTWLPEEYQKPGDGHYARHSLYRDPLDRFEILALVWKPGQRTLLHDHDGAWGVEGIMRGTIMVHNYSMISEISESVVRLTQTDVQTLSSHGSKRFFPQSDCHMVEAVGHETVLTLHVYGKQLVNYGIYEPTQQEDVFRRVAYHPVGN